MTGRLEGKGGFLEERTEMNKGLKVGRQVPIWESRTPLHNSSRGSTTGSAHCTG